MDKSSRGVSRRGFLSATASGVLGIGLAGLGPRRLAAKDEKKEKKGKIITRGLGNTGIELPIVSMGVMNANNPEVVRASIESGIRHLDTAAYYQGGNNEKMVGKVISEMGVRDDVVIATKIYTPNMRRGDKPEDTRRKMLGQMDECLSRLGMDHVDILYVHVVESREFVLDETVHETMEEIRKKGKTRFTGISTHKNMHEVIGAATDSGNYDIVLTAINFTMADDSKLLSEIERAAGKGIGIVAMKTQSGGRRFPLPEGTEDYESSTINTAALKWVLRNENITTAIPGYTTLEHMREDFSVAYDLEYTEREKSLIRDCNVKVGLGFCKQCDSCVESCPYGVDIPSLMRTHMYAAQYSNFDQARRTLLGIEKGSGLDVCELCAGCKVRCPHRVDVAGRITELRTIYS
jgi:predicted aldo/keto reductase-like oxidoreductase